MNKLSALAAASLMATALAAGMTAPAQAQDRYGWGSPQFYDAGRGNHIREQIWELDSDLDQADRRGAISDSDVYSLRREVRALRNWYEMSARNGLSYQEVRYLQDRVNRIRYKLRLEGYRWDREDYWRNYDNSNDWRDRDRDGYGNIDGMNRDWDNDPVPDRVERDWDSDGTPDSVDRDRDNDGIPNSGDPDDYSRY